MAALFSWTRPLCLLFLSMSSSWAQDNRVWELAGNVEYPRDSLGTFSFVAVGDWGCGANNCDIKPDADHMLAGQRQAEVAEGLGEAALAVNSKLVVALGDNFYFAGVQSIDDPLWESVWRSRFTHPALQTPWYAILGNHDHYGNAFAQIQYSLAGMDRRWIMPNYYWATAHTIGSRKLQMVFIDTVLLDEDITRRDLLAKIASGHVDEDILRKYDALRSVRTRAGEEQLAWLDDTLRSSDADWLLVCGHYPIFSGGEHGSTESLLLKVKPLLDKYRVDAYLAGHDHTLQHLTSGNVQYYVVGSGALMGTVRSLPQTRYASVESGFSVHQVSEDALKTTFMDALGTPIYTHTIRRSRT